MIEVLKQMVEALEWSHGGEPIGTAEAIKAGKQAIAELESQEPVAYLCENAVGHKYFRWKKPTSIYKPIPLYTHPPQRTEPVIDKSAAIRIATALGWTPPRTWVGLTDEEKHKTWYEMQNIMSWYSFQEIANAIEAKVKERNI